MNIFFLDENPDICAQYHHDVHLRKMIIETAQLLCSAHHILNSTLDKSQLYKLTHKNHPMAIWVREFPDNYYWALNLGLSLIHEYEFRFKKNHKTKSILAKLNTNCDYMFKKTNSPTLTFSQYFITDPPRCMPDIYKTGNIVESYRNYYINEKMFDKNNKPIDKYTIRNRPDFLC